MESQNVQGTPAPADLPHHCQHHGFPGKKLGVILSCISALWMIQGRVVDIRTQEGCLQWSSQAHAQNRDPHSVGHLRVTGEGNRKLVE